MALPRLPVKLLKPIIFLGVLCAPQVLASSGASLCFLASPRQSPACTSDVPSDGFPGRTPEESNAAWPSGKQPWNLECWPKNSTGDLVPCNSVQAIESEESGWPGKCTGLTLQPDVNASCESHCQANPLCPSWQIGTDGACWEGLGTDCFVRQNFKPQQAQRLQHGNVRVLMDLTGWHIIGLYRVFDNSNGYFLEQDDAITACKRVCYSEVTCQYWQYSPTYGCWVQDAAQELQPIYPLTLQYAFRDTLFALDCVAGEMIQHFCPASAVPAYQRGCCLNRGVHYYPADMPLQARTFAPNAEACQKRCELTRGCAHFSFWPDGGCHLADANATWQMVDDFSIVSGPRTCLTARPAPPSAAAPAAAAAPSSWMTQEGAEALNGIHGVPTAQPGHAVLSEEHEVKITVTVQNVEYGLLTPEERLSLQTNYAKVLASALNTTADSVNVTLASFPPGSMQLTALALAKDLRIVQAAIGTTTVSNQLAETTSQTLSANDVAFRGAVSIVDAKAVIEHKAVAAAPVEECNWWCRCWPILLALLLLACVSGLVAFFVLGRGPKMAKRGYSRESSDFDSDGDDEEIWASEPPWRPDARQLPPLTAPAPAPGRSEFTV